MRLNWRNWWIADCIAASGETKAPLLLIMLCLSPTVIYSTCGSVHVVCLLGIFQCLLFQWQVQLRLGWRHFFQSMDQLDTRVPREWWMELLFFSWDFFEWGDIWWQTLGTWAISIWSGIWQFPLADAIPERMTSQWNDNGRCRCWMFYYVC